MAGFYSAVDKARMRAMIAAQDNTSDTLTELIQTSRSLRQDEITEEIVELATASLPVR
ncbi:MULTISPECIES: F0F1 ATP synthase subunit gamma [Thioclava]|uniref:F0F1 ATP synthase subunit gamma n=1 Tax=Thioclava TaxID=285107 RepID=UPI0019801AA7|nr:MULTISPECIES: F0F1 ATP synthase subunit gamma [Thioclava]WGT50465.1 F0F1 ATP synthase subunit gamma [Thioclava nitratireducens]